MKKALIIGGNGGIGGAITHLLDKSGYAVYATYFSRVPAQDPKITFLKCDVRKAEDRERVLQAVVSDGEGVDIFINAASPPLALKSFEDTSSQKMREDMDIHFFGTETFVREILPGMKRQKSGIIISLLSQTLDTPSARMSSYVAAKAALLSFMRSLSAETSSSGVRFVSLFLPMVDTPLLSAFPAKLLEIMRERKEGILSPEKVAEKVRAIIEHPNEYPSGSEIKLYES